MHIIFLMAFFMPLFCHAQIVSTEPTMTSIAATNTLINHMGRNEKKIDGSLRFAYPGVSFLINFEGKTLTLDAKSSGNQSYLDIIIDGHTTKTIQLSPAFKTINLVDENISKKHSIEIVHRSETWHGIVTFKQFSTDGKFTQTAAQPNRKILVLGDSVTCGEAIDRIAGDTKNSSWWNPRLSYGMLTAKILQAQVNLVCFGGRGLIRSWNGKTDEQNLPDFYQLAIADSTHPARWNHAEYEPDVIVSTIGTNDFSQGIPDREIYINAYVTFLRTLLDNHPHAQLLLSTGAILEGDKKTALIEYINEAIKRVGRKQIHFVASSHYQGDGIDIHPTKEQHQKMAAELTTQLKKIMQW